MYFSCGAYNKRHCVYIISALRQTVLVFHCSTDVSLAEDLCNFLDPDLFFTILTSEKHMSSTDIKISSDSEVKDAVSHFDKTLVLLTDRCSALFTDAVQTLLLLTEIKDKVCLILCDTNAKYFDTFEGDYISTNIDLMKPNVLNFLQKQNGKF